MYPYPVLVEGVEAPKCQSAIPTEAFARILLFHNFPSAIKIACVLNTPSAWASRT